MPYDFSLESSDALRFLIRQRASDRTLLFRFFDRLAEDPYLAGDFRETDSGGRPIEVAIQGRFIVSYWTDHAVKQVRIVKIELVTKRI